MRASRVVTALQAVLGTSGAVGLTVLFLGHPGRPAPDVGQLDPIHATAAERAEVHTMHWGETLGEILGSVLDGNEQQALLMAFQERSSARRLRTGTEVTLRYRTGTDALRAVDIALNPDSTVRLVRDGFVWRTSVIHTPVFVDTLYAAGTVDTAIWNAIMYNPGLEGIPAQDRTTLTWQLERIFEWRIDFTRQIQPGDYYRFAYERLVRPDGSLQAGKIVAAEVINAGKGTHAILFDPDGEDGDEASYYDLEGNSLRGAFLLRPVEFRYISSRFSNARLHPILGTWRAHRGIDYAADAGTPVRATANGTIVTRGVSGGYGNLVEIQHANGFRTRYGHLRRFTSGQAVGTRVEQGDYVGEVGMTGLATGPHLHYEMIRNGTHLDPLNAQLPHGDPVPAAAQERWMWERVDRLALLEVLPGPGETRFAARISSMSDVGDVEAEPPPPPDGGGS